MKNLKYISGLAAILMATGCASVRNNNGSVESQENVEYGVPSSKQVYWSDTPLTAVANNLGSVGNFLGITRPRKRPNSNTVKEDVKSGESFEIFLPHTGKYRFKCDYIEVIDDYRIRFNTPENMKGETISSIIYREDGTRYGEIIANIQ